MEERQIISDLKKKIFQVEALLEVYNPTIYPPEVLSIHRVDWTRKVETAFTDVTEAHFGVTELRLDNQEEYDGLVRGTRDKVSTFLLDISVKALSLTSGTADGSHGNSQFSASAHCAPNYEARNAAAAIEVDVEELQVAVKSLLREIRMTEDVGAAEDHEVAVMMQSVTPWRKRFRDIQAKYFMIKKKVNQFQLDEQTFLEAQTRPPCATWRPSLRRRSRTLSTRTVRGSCSPSPGRSLATSSIPPSAGTTPRTTPGLNTRLSPPSSPIKSPRRIASRSSEIVWMAML